MNTRIILFSLFGLVLFTSCNATLYFGGYYASWFRAPFEGRLEMREQVFSGPSQLVRYEHFFNLCAEIEALEVRIDSLETQESLTEKEEKELRGLVGIRASRVSQYNADARKENTSANFLSANLPYQIVMNESTRCSR